MSVGLTRAPRKRASISNGVVKLACGFARRALSRPTGGLSPAPVVTLKAAILAFPPPIAPTGDLPVKKVISSCIAVGLSFIFGGAKVQAADLKVGDSAPD